MSKYSLILILSVALSGCSVFNKQGKSIITGRNIKAKTLADLKSSNITGSDFYVQKAEIRIEAEGKKEKLLGSLKFNYPGTYLFSIKSLTGIEAARIMITDDTVLVNDRINKNLFYGSSENLGNKYGIVFEMLPLLVGDFIDTKSDEGVTIDCIEEISKVEGYIEEKKILYEIDCNKSKVKEAYIYDLSGEQGLKFKMSEFNENDTLCYPEVIIVEDKNRETIITVKIEKIRFYNLEELEFKPGNDYKKILLK